MTETQTLEDYILERIAFREYGKLNYQHERDDSRVHSCLMALDELTSIAHKAGISEEKIVTAYDQGHDRYQRELAQWDIEED